MGSLSPKERDLLFRFDQKESFRVPFLQRVRGLKWFNHLNERGCFDPCTVPPPQSASEEGYVRIVTWPITDYLLKTSPELAEEANREYAEEFLQILVSATEYAKEKDFTNHHTWWRFAKIMGEIPIEVISLENLWIVDYWLDDKFQTSLVADELGEVWLPNLLTQRTSHALALCGTVMGHLYKVKFREAKFSVTSSKDAFLRVEPYHINGITDRIARLTGSVMGTEAVDIFHDALKFILTTLEKDAWSSIWHPAIEDHDQNQYHDHAENTIVTAYRECLEGFLETHPAQGFKRVSEMLSDEHQTIKRIAIHTITENYLVCWNLSDRLISEEFLQENYRHEMWRYLNRHYVRFSANQKSRLFELISEIARNNDQGEFLEAATAYAQANWLAAIREHSDEEMQLYQERVAKARTEPDHPDFSSFLSFEAEIVESNTLVDTFRGMEVGKIVDHLKASNKGDSDWWAQDLQNPSKALRQAVKVEPMKFYAQLNQFLGCNGRFSVDLIEALMETLNHKINLPKEEVWLELLKFSENIVSQDGFWDGSENNAGSSFSTTQRELVSSVTTLIENVTSPNSNHLNEAHLCIAERILKELLPRVPSDKFSEHTDAMFFAINSPKGRVLSATISYALHQFRRAADNNADHSAVWRRFEPIFESQLRTSRERKEYEFVTLATRYLRQFMYMSQAWTLEKLAQLFDREDRTSWRCAMQGWTQAHVLNPDIFNFLKSEGHLIEALDDVLLKEGAIRRICDALLKGYEGLADEDSIIRSFIQRMRHDELTCAIGYLEGCGSEYHASVTALWNEVSKQLDLSIAEHKRIASDLCVWAKFIEKVDDTNRQLILRVAPYVDFQHNSYQFIQFIARISRSQPIEAADIWIETLTESTPIYPLEELETALRNLCAGGSEGIRKAREIVSRYLSVGIEVPHSMLSEITEKKNRRESS